MNGKATVKIIKEFCVKNAPTILTCVGIAELLGTSYLWVKNTPKAQEKLKKAEEEKGEKLTKTEKVKAAAPAYIPAATGTILTATTFLLANRISAKQLAAVIAAYQLSEEAREEWKENTYKTVGEKKYQDIEQNIARSHMDQVPIGEEGIINTGKGRTLYFDKYGGRYFWSDRQFLHEVELDMNDLLSEKQDICLNDFYDMILLDHVKHGDEMIWKKYDPYRRNDGQPGVVDRIRIKYTADMHPTLKIACTEIDFYDEPTSIPF